MARGSAWGSEGQAGRTRRRWLPPGAGLALPCVCGPRLLRLLPAVPLAVAARARVPAGTFHPGHRHPQSRARRQHTGLPKVSNAHSVSPLLLRDPCPQPGSCTFSPPPQIARHWLARSPWGASRSGPGEGAMCLLSCAGGPWASRVVTYRGLHRKSPDPKSHCLGAVPRGPRMNRGATLRVPEAREGAIILHRQKQRPRAPSKWSLEGLG